jgi:hypothetical protein
MSNFKKVIMLSKAYPQNFNFWVFSDDGMVDGPVAE